MTIANVAPTVTLTGPAHDADEGQTKTYTFTVSDPGADTFVPWSRAAAPTAPTPPTRLGAGSFDCTFPDGPASSTVTVTANDEDPGPASEDTRLVTIANVKPTVTITSGAMTADEGQTKVYTYTVSDPGDDTLTVVESCGANATYAADALANSFECTFPDGPASSTVTVTANDEDPGPASEDTRLVTINNVAPTVAESRLARGRGNHE